MWDESRSQRRQEAWEAERPGGLASETRKLSSPGHRREEGGGDHSELPGSMAKVEGAPAMTQAPFSKARRR